MRSAFATRSAVRKEDSMAIATGTRIINAKTLIGEKVVNLQEEDLGKLEAIMIDTTNGKVAYAVLSFGGFLGLGDKLFAIPWDTLRLDTENERFILDIPKDRLESAPGFDKDHWPDMVDPQWSAEIHS